ncbi:MAG: hypothetical protein WBP61_02385 [Nocardioides sp.]
MTELAPVLAVVAVAVGAGNTLPYAYDAVRRTTVPHRGTWLIWSVLGVVSLESQRADGARWSLLPLATQAAGTCVILGLSVRVGSGGLSRAEVALLALAGLGVAGWQAVDTPVVATACVIVADLIGAVLMVPKTWRDPSSETLSLFVLAAVGGAATAGSVGSLSAPLVMYPIYYFLVNAALGTLILLRRGSRRRCAAIAVSA